MLIQTIHRVFKIDYISNMANMIKGKNHHIAIVKILLQWQSHVNYYVVKHPDDSLKGFGNRVFSIHMTLKTSRNSCRVLKAFG